MLQPSTIQFLKQLGQNNDRDWFQANKKQFVAAAADFSGIVQNLIDRSSEFDNSLKGLKSKDCLFRIYRDVRFSKDKSPYKPNFGASITQGGRKSVVPGYYIHIQPGGKSFLAGGLYMPEKALLEKVRQEIDYNTEEFKAIIHKASFKSHWGELNGDKLKKAPKDYPSTHPEIELLKFKSFIVSKNMDDKALESKNFIEGCVAAFKELHPFNLFLRRALN